MYLYYINIKNLVFYASSEANKFKFEQRLFSLINRITFKTRVPNNINFIQTEPEQNKKTNIICTIKSQTDKELKYTSSTHLYSITNFLKEFKNKYHFTSSFS